MGQRTSLSSNTARRIRVLIVDDHELVRSGLRFFLLAFDDLELVGEASGGEEAVEICTQSRPDVILLDLMMSGMSGIETTRVLRERCPYIRIIALTNFQDPDSVQGALQAGVTGYLLKNVNATELSGAIRAAYRGQPILAPEATQALISATTRPETPKYDLTPREREVLTLLVEGMSNAEIARHLTIGLSTVKFHVSSTFSKLGISSRAEAIALAWQHQLVNRQTNNLPF